MINSLICTTVSSAGVKYLLIALGFAGALILLGLFLRTKVKFLQKLFLPASVIGGFIGLFLGGQVLGKWLPGYYKFINLEWLGTEASPLTLIDDVNAIFGVLPEILIIPIFASTPLGNFAKKKTKEEKAAEKAKGHGGIGMGIFFILMGMMVIQMLIGFGVNIICTKCGADLYSQFGYELALGFVGGHGTAASVKGLYGTVFAEFYGKELGATMIGVSQSVGLTFATVGLVGGMLLGIIFINIASRKGETTIIKEPIKLEGEQLTGINTDSTKQESMGRQTVKNFTVESLTIHLGIIAIVCGLAYFVVKVLSKLPGYAGTLLGKLPVWSVAMLIMFGVNALIKKLNLTWLIDKKVVSRIAGTLTDIAIVCAVASMNLTAIIQYWLPITICCVIGFVATYFYIFKLTKMICKDESPFEHSIIGWGACSGVMMTGLMLLKICDPNYETKALGNFTKSFAIMSVSQLVLFIVYQSFFKKTTLALFLVTLLFAVIFTACFFGVWFANRKKEKVAVAA